MEYTARIRQGLGLKAAEVTLRPGEITIATGNNATGKSTLATLVAAAFCEKANPLLAEAPKGAYVTDGAVDGGEVTIRRSGGEDENENENLVFWDLQTNEMTVGTGGIAPSSPASVGLVDFTAKQTLSARQKMYEELLMPPAATMINRLRKMLHGVVNDQTLADVLEVVGKDGLDAVDSTMKARRAEAKRRWQKITNVAKYGQDKAMKWLPDAWTADMDGMTIPQAEQLLVEARKRVSMTTAEKVISATERAEAQQAASDLPELEAHLRDVLKPQLEELRQQHQSHIEKRDEAHKELRDVLAAIADHEASRPTEENPAKCPCCQAELIVVSRSELKEFNRENYEGEMGKWRARGHDLESDRANANAIYEALRPPVDAAAEDVKKYSELVWAKDEQIRQLKEKAEAADLPLESDDRQTQARDAEIEVEKAEARLGMLKQEQAAREAHEMQMQYNEVCNKLGSSGFKAAAMEQAMSNLNKVLERISNITGWGPVQVTPVSYVVRYGEHVFPSESEKWRAQVSIQIAMQILLQDPVVIIDRADVLDEYSAEEFAKLVEVTASPLKPDGEPKKIPPPAILICGTTSSDETPAWAFSLKRYYWHHTSGGSLDAGMLVDNAAEE